jgi:Xaa-Pro dipeptidase
MDNLQKMGLTQLLISDMTAIYYLTGQRFFPGERLVLLHISTGGNTLYLNELSQETEPIKDVETIRFSLGDDGLSRVIKGIGKGALGVDKNLPARYLIPLLHESGAGDVIVASEAVDRARARKDIQEQAYMAESSEINDRAMEQFEKLIQEGVTERGVQEQMRGIYKELGADDIGFGFSAFGANAAEPHHASDDTVLKEGDCVVLDVGCIKYGYFSDMTRTFFYKSVSGRHREIYEIVKLANETAQKIVRPGVRFSDIDRTARDIIAAAGYGEYFIHRLGHSIGLQMHEYGDVSAYNDDLVEEGMIFSIEPGIYLPGDFGVRIEDLVLATENGVRSLNGYSKELKVID